MQVLEGLTLHQALWLTMTTLTTVGYGDLSPKTIAGQIATIGLMYVIGITLLTLIVSDYIDYRFFRREAIRTGRWRWNMINHIVVINTPKNIGIHYYERLVQQIRVHEDYRTIPIQLLTKEFPDGLPPEMVDLDLVHFHGTGTNIHDLAAVNPDQAKHIIVLAQDAGNPESDSTAFDVLHRLMEYNLAKKAVVECVLDENRARLGKLGARAILRPVRTYPEIIVRALLAPGAEKVLEDLFTHENDHPHRYDIEVDHLQWEEVVCALIQADLGTAIAYIEPTGEVVCHPPAHEKLTASALIILVKTDRTPTTAEVEAALRHYKKRMADWDSVRQQLEEEAEANKAR
ncbi:MAG: two pore domain potassium channel family protein [Hahellaceae bacterium]|nr:two pore domain potassium channel family protein [Hahellaceae bacterium]MCP5168636.1 two pore domain potassium channel family protein [Hahellaceae bacterium]